MRMIAIFFYVLLLAPSGVAFLQMSFNASPDRLQGNTFSSSPFTKSVYPRSANLDVNTVYYSKQGLSLYSSVSTSATAVSTSILESKQTTSTQFPSKDEYYRGLWIIAFITILFSSNSPVLHAVFVNSVHPPPVLLLNAATSTIALGGMFAGGPILDAIVPRPCTLSDNPARFCTTNSNKLSIQAGLELGLWKTLGTTANLYGLSMTSADHGAFLIQLTTLIVPVVQGLMGVPIPKRIWTSVLLALLGVFLFTQDPGGVGQSSSLVGDSLCMLAAVFYATYDLRLFEWGKKVAPLQLITSKIAVQAGLSLALLAGFQLSDSAEYVHNLLSSGVTADSFLVLSAALWSGIAVNAIAPFLQVGGQQAIGATRAQVVYASQPLWASILSWSLLHETVGVAGLSGGILFLSAMFLASTAESARDNGREIADTI